MAQLVSAVVVTAALLGTTWVTLLPRPGALVTVVTWPWAATSAAAIIGQVDGAVIGPPSHAFTATAFSSAPDFAHRLRAAGAVLVIGGHAVLCGPGGADL